MKKAVNKGKRELSSSRDRMTEHEEFYREKLALDAPIQYWSGKATSHLKSVIGFTIATGVAFVGAAIWINTAVIDSGLGQTKLSELTLGKVSTLALVTLIGIWILRILIRMLLSNAHLLNDARERVVMINAYLALLDSKKIPEESIGLILQALFRPTSTGIVKDDGSPPFMAEWLKRTTGMD